ncbi:MAG TPA: hypothetical protein VF837_02270 [Patescibacteria group bacterium]
MADLFMINESQQSSQIISLKLSNATDHFFVRLTGGSGKISFKDGVRGITSLMKELSQFKGIIISGGTRIINKPDLKVHPSIQEVGSFIKAKNPHVRVFGIVPRQEVLQLRKEGVLVLEEETQFTVINPDFDVVLIVQKNVDDGSPWETEWRESFRIVSQFRSYSDYRCALIAYNGGNITKDEIRVWAAYKWPVLLIKDSGRVTDELANNPEFLKENPTVSVISVDEIRSSLRRLGAKI